KSANEGDAYDFDLKADLFMQLAADGLFGLFARTHKTAGDAPAAAGTKTVMKQQDSIARINRHSAYGHGEARFGQQYAQAARPFRRAPPQSRKGSLQHICRVQPLIRAFPDGKKREKTKQTKKIKEQR